MVKVCSENFASTMSFEPLTPSYFLKLMESQFYGASNVISLLQNQKVALTPFANWMHGWKFGYKNWGLGAFVDVTPRYKNLTKYNLVTLKAYEDLLRDAGYIKSVAVGSPYLYALEYMKSSNFERKPSSLLIMPTHSLKGIEIDPKRLYEYIESKICLAGDFDYICVCLHSNSVGEGELSSWLDERNIPWVMGGVSDDNNSLLRLVQIFSTFEYVSTNCLGTHIPYAIASGCRLSLDFDYYYPLSWKEMAKNIFYKRNPDLLEVAKIVTAKSYLHEKVPFTIVDHPKQAVAHVAWGREELGCGSMKPVEKFNTYFGWTTPEYQCRSLFLAGQRFVHSAADLAMAILKRR